MRSAETSGATAKGDTLRRRALHNAVATPVIGLGRLAEDLSPVTIAVALTAFGAAVLFVSYDLVRSLDEARLLVRLAGTPDIGGAWGGVIQRGVLALALAVVAAALAYRHNSTGGRSLAERRRLRELVATIPFGVALWTREGTLIVCNDHYLERLQLEGPEVGPGRSYHEAIKRLTRGGYVRLVNDGETNRLLELHREDGSCLLIEERPLESSGFITLVTDITERKRTDMLLNSVQAEQRQLARRYHEEKLKAEAASQAKTSFLAHLSHDIRTPLNHIIGFAELIRHETYGPLGDARYVGYVEMIKASGDKLLASFASILELAEFESGSRPLREAQLSIDELVLAVTRRFSAQAGRAGLALALGAPCRAELLGDRFCLERMLGNLVENAIRFTPSGGKITLAAYAAADGVVLEVSDTGIGMSDELLERLSQPFVFGDAAFTREHPGAGLGIAIARAIAELSGGRLAIDSRPALGTTVAISLPLRPAGIDGATARAA
jgi:two-component system cell cycle sensor histidine kinase PleC